MSWLQRILGSSRVNYRSDSFTLTTRGKYSRLRQWLNDLVERDRPIVLLCHFESTFLEIQTVLDQFEIDFDILARSLTRTVLMQQFEHGLRKPVLTMASMLQVDELAPSRSSALESLNLAVIVLERYPNPVRDELIESFARSLGCPVQLGYLLSFEDPLIRELLGQNFIDLMQQLGLGENDLVSSAMSSRALSRAIKRRSKNVVDETVAQSPLEWLAANRTSNRD
jgi:hypothetical protein